jgi:hypothetical protein
LLECENCNELADPYVEFEISIISLELLLVKPKVFRHLLWNRFWHGKGTGVSQDVGDRIVGSSRKFVTTNSLELTLEIKL